MYEVLQDFYVEDAGVWLEGGMRLDPDALDPEIMAELVFAGVLALEGQPAPAAPEPDANDDDAPEPDDID